MKSQSDAEPATLQSSSSKKGSAKTILDPAKVLGIISPDGLLTQRFSGFQPRAGQQSMMQTVLNAYERSACALVEAGTGIGKSIAYLVPALLWAAKTQERTVISTHTIPLQEQLVQKDVPFLLKALGLDIQVSLVKGMSNYICLRKWGDVMDVVTTLPSKESEELQKIEPWVDNVYTQKKSASKLPIVPSASTWELISADRETCTGRVCPEYARCPFMQDRLQAKESQILIVNHHLLFSDLAMRLINEGNDDKNILPAYSRLVLDEAHHVEDVARDRLALQLSQRETFRLLARISREQHGPLAMLRSHFTQWTIQQKGEFSPTIATIYQRLQVELPALHHDVIEALTHCFLGFERYMQSQNSSAEGASERKGELRLRLRNKQQTEPIWQELFGLMNRAAKQIHSYAASINGVLNECTELADAAFDERTQTIRAQIKSLLGNLANTSDLLERMQKPFVEKDQVRWLYKISAAGGQDVGMVEAPLDMVEALRTHLFEPMRTVVLCSATLTTDGTFEFLRGRLGLKAEQLGKRLVLEERQLSPFSYATQALFAIPTDLPEPAAPEFFDAAVEAIWKALEASRGNALVLFTSYSMLLAVYSALQKRCAERRFPLLRQGEASRSFLLEALRNDDHSILFATYSFWEGVDVVGEALRCVIIVKLPFPVPNEPLFQAQSERILAEGKNPFLELAVPSAMIRFTQGFGRLIRNQRDRGCVLCFDTRLVTRSYGARFLGSLPPCKRVIDKSATVWEEMTAFYRKTHYLTVAPSA